MNEDEELKKSLSFEAYTDGVSRTIWKVPSSKATLLALAKRELPFGSVKDNSRSSQLITLVHAYATVASCVAYSPRSRYENEQNLNTTMTKQDHMKTDLKVKPYWFDQYRFLNFLSCYFVYWNIRFKIKGILGALALSPWFLIHKSGRYDSGEAA